MTKPPNLAEPLQRDVDGVGDAVDGDTSCAALDPRVGAGRKQACACLRRDAPRELQPFRAERRTADEQQRLVAGPQSGRGAADGDPPADEAGSDAAEPSATGGYCDSLTSGSMSSARRIAAA